MSTTTSTLVCASTHSSVPHSDPGQWPTLPRRGTAAYTTAQSGRARQREGGGAAAPLWPHDRPQDETRAGMTDMTRHAQGGSGPPLTIVHRTARGQCMGASPSTSFPARPPPPHTRIRYPHIPPPPQPSLGQGAEENGFIDSLCPSPPPSPHRPRCASPPPWTLTWPGRAG